MICFNKSSHQNDWITYNSIKITYNKTMNQFKFLCNKVMVQLGNCDIKINIKSLYFKEKFLNITTLVQVFLTFL